MLETPFTRLLGVAAPIQLAPMPGIATPTLASAVAAAGGVGMIPTPLVPGPVLEQTLAALPDPAPGAIGVSFLMPFLDRACVEVAARRAVLLDFFYGEPDAELVRLAKSHGARVSWQVGSVPEALAAERAGCDVLIAQGTEAGGHVRGQTSQLPLLAQVLDAVRVPVLAAGGVATGRELAAVLACGAAGARIGTRFIAAAESGAHRDYVEALVAASAADTCVTEAFSVMWPHAPHRVLRSSIEAAQSLTDEVIGTTRLGGQEIPVRRSSVMSPTKETTGRVDAMALYAGESVDHVKQVEPAAAIIAQLVAGAEQALDRHAR